MRIAPVMARLISDIELFNTGLSGTVLQRIGLRRAARPRGPLADSGAEHLSTGTLEIQDRSLQMNLRGVTPSGCVAVGPSASRLSVGDGCAVALVIGDHRIGRLEAEVESVREDTARFGFRTISIHQARAVLSAQRTMRRAGPPTSPRAQERVVDPARIQSMCQALVLNQCEGVLHTADGPMKVQGLALQLDADLPLRWTVPVAPRNPTALVIHGPLSTFEVPIRRHRFDGALATDLPSHITRTRCRRWARVGVPDAEITFAHPLFPQLTVRTALRDICQRGVSFGADPVADLVYPGLQITDASIRVGRRTHDVQADLRHVTSAFSGGRLQAGDPDAWNQLVGARLHPGTQLRGASARRLWSLYTESGYFNLSGKSKKHFSAKRKAYEAANRKLDCAPDIACKVVYTSQSGKYEAALTAARTYQNTWFGFHMAKRKGITEDGVSAREVLRQIHLRTYEHVLDDPNARWVLGYVQHKPGLHFPRMVHVAFPEYCLPTGKSCVMVFRAIQLAARRAACPLPGGFTTHPATPEELDALAEVIAQGRPEPYTEALDFTRDRLQMTVNKADWSQAGLQRDREIFVARRGERAVAALVVESAADGVHLYDLLDCARVFPLVEGGEEAFDALLEFAREWFSDRGKPQFIYKQEYGDLDAPCAPGQIDLGKADLAVLSTELLPDFLEQMWEVTSQRPPRKATTAAAS